MQAERGKDGMTITLKAEADKVKAGERGNLILDAFVEREPEAGKGPNRRRQPLGVLPAIPFEIVSR